jgi:hypothetical protein
LRIYESQALRYSFLVGKTIDSAAAAARLGVNLQRIRALLGARRIPGARRIGRQWFVPEDFEVTPGTRGPKR